jgi:hypothetical protein
MRLAMLLFALSTLVACSPRADQVYVAPTRLLTGSSGAQPGHAVKLVRAKEEHSEVLGDDGSVCRLTPERFDEVKVGSWLACDWTH